MLDIANVCHYASRKTTAHPSMVSRKTMVHMRVLTACDIDERIRPDGLQIFFLSLLWKFSGSEMNPSTLWGPKRRSELCSLHSAQHGQIHVVKASRGISTVMARAGWNGQTELQTVLRLTLHMSNLWCLKRGRSHRLNCSYHKHKWQHFLILQLLSSLSI